MKSLLFIVCLAFATSSILHAETQSSTPGEVKIAFNFKNEDLSKIIEVYAKAAGQKWIIDPGVRGKISILNSQDVTSSEAYNQISNALSVNGFAISKQQDLFVVQTARSVQRSYIETATELPAMVPTRLATWVIQLKNISAREVQIQIRTLSSRDGEITAFEPNNQIIITDWTPNLHRVADLIKQLDIPVNKAIADLVKKSRKEHDERQAMKMKKDMDHKKEDSKESTN